MKYFEGGSMEPAGNIFDGAVTCAVDFEPLTKAMAVLPCAHSFNENACVATFGRIVANGACEKMNIPCPICRTIVTSYVPNHQMRDLVQRVLQLQGNASQVEKNEKKRPLEVPEEPPVVVVKKAAVEPAYPGNPSKFIHSDGDWQHFNSGGRLDKCLKFKSLNENALFTEFSLLGYTDDTHAIMLESSKVNPSLSLF